MFKSFYSDPKPWLTNPANEDSARVATVNDLDSYFSENQFNPRSFYDAMEVNRILQEFREDYRWVMNWVPFMDERVEWLTNPEEATRIWKSPYNLHTDAEIDHAREVITRLRKLRN